MSEQQYQAEVMDELKQYQLMTIGNIFREILPCDTCVDWDKCKHELLACNAFQSYVVGGWFRLRDRVNPTEKTYIKIFKESVND